MDHFFPFENQPTVAVATSGGPDSLALCLLLNQWINRNNGKLISLTFDHRLRPESTSEAEHVKKWLTKYGIEHHILSWQGEKPTTDIQNKARIARHKHLEEWCEEHHILHLCFAHHQGDQEETILQRLLHASGPAGLQGMQPCTYRPFGRVLRPLLSFSKQQLIAFLTQEKQPYFSDPGNLNPSFERVKVRAILPRLKELTITPYPLNQVGLKCHDFTEIAYEALTKFSLKSLEINCLGFIKIQKGNFLNLSFPLQSLILSHCLQAVGGSAYPFSSKSLSYVLKKINDYKNTTIGGCFIVIKASEIWIVREERCIPKSVEILQNRTHWDYRFLIDVSNSFIGTKIIPRSVLPLSIQTSFSLEDIPDYVLKTLPFIQQTDGKIIPAFTTGSDISIQLRLKNRLLPPLY